MSRIPRPPLETMRPVSCSAGEPLVRPHDPDFSVRSWLEERGSGLLHARFTPPPEISSEVGHQAGLACDAATWLNRCALWGRRDARWLLLVGQAEQGLALDATLRSASYRVEVELPEDGPVSDPGENAWLSRGRLVRLLEGDGKMAAFGGAGIPDPFENAPWSVELYLGFDRQAYQIARLARRDLDTWDQGGRAILLQRNADTSEDPRGARVDEWVRCEDFQSFQLLHWTPWEIVLKQRPAIYHGRRMFGTA